MRVTTALRMLPLVTSGNKIRPVSDWEADPQLSLVTLSDPSGSHNR